MWAQMHHCAFPCVPFPMLKQTKIPTKIRNTWYFLRQNHCRKDVSICTSFCYILKCLLIQFWCNVSYYDCAHHGVFSHRKCFLFSRPSLFFRVAVNFWFLDLPHNSKNTRQACHHRQWLLWNQTFNQRPLCLQYEKLSGLYHLPTIYK